MTEREPGIGQCLIERVLDNVELGPRGTVSMRTKVIVILDPAVSVDDTGGDGVVDDVVDVRAGTEQVSDAILLSLQESPGPSSPKGRFW